MKILFVSSEGLPYSKTGGLADVVEALPAALQALGHEVAVLLPRYHGNKIKSTLVSSVSTQLGDKMRFPAIGEGLPVKGVRYFFVDDPQYFDRAHLYGDKTGDYPDNAERFAEFSRVAIELVKRVWLPDVIHCHDWQSALVPRAAADAARKAIPWCGRCRWSSRFTISAIRDCFRKRRCKSIGLPDTLFTMDALEFYGKVNFLKGGLIFADYLTTVSRRYAKEIQTPEYGCGSRGRDPQPRGAAGGHSEWRGLHSVES